VTVRTAGADGEHRADGFRNDIVGGGERHVAGPAAAASGFAAHDDQVRGDFLRFFENLVGSVSEAHAKLGWREGAIHSGQLVAHVLDVDLSEMV